VWGGGGGGVRRGDRCCGGRVIRGAVLGCAGQVVIQWDDKATVRTGSFMAGAHGGRDSVCL